MRTAIVFILLISATAQAQDLTSQIFGEEAAKHKETKMFADVVTKIILDKCLEAAVSDAQRNGCRQTYRPGEIAKYLPTPETDNSPQPTPIPIDVPKTTTDGTIPLY